MEKLIAITERNKTTNPTYSGKVVMVSNGEAIKINPTMVVSKPEANFHPQLSNSFRLDIEKIISEIPLTKNETLKSIASAKKELSGVIKTQMPSAM